MSLSLIQRESQQRQDTLERKHTHRENGINVMDYCRHAPVISADEKCQDVMKVFGKEAKSDCAVICEEFNKPVALLMRDRFYRRLTSRFGADLYYHLPAFQFADENCLMVESDVPIQSVIDLALERTDEHFYDCIILTNEGRYIGILTVKDLLQISRRLQEQANDSQLHILNETDYLTGQIDGSINELTTAADAGVHESKAMSEMTNLGRTQLMKVKQSLEQVVLESSLQENNAAELNERVRHITSTTDAIRELAEQSQLLAINASIEAAHAGELGQGFGVVSEHMRHLAQQTKSLSENIINMLHSIKNTADQTKHLTQTVRDELTQSNQYVEEAVTQFEALLESVLAGEKRSQQMFTYASAAMEKTAIVRSELLKIRSMKMND
ncbi:methyl-accepting chemotaxis protein [Paenibacillus sediminis]|uniref:Methyl-accepting chemotaxis protein n=1 Tax=Paenibacillus sediminis TaxID=664909 RepID=A0ABS4H5I9_9BACL|nr:methyl-accepting chemotaxis protein [Paenibacillus sediminis]MBP1937799.1 methyl-accepting chemotaxis protein [Paenibacillus sediminis]